MNTKIVKIQLKTAFLLPPFPFSLLRANTVPGVLAPPTKANPNRRHEILRVLTQKNRRKAWQNLSKLKHTNPQGHATLTGV